MDEIHIALPRASQLWNEHVSGADGATDAQCTSAAAHMRARNLTALLGGLTPEHLRLMQEIQATLTMKQQQLAQQPNHPVLTNVVNVLTQLLAMVPTLQLNPTVIAGIQQTLAMQRSSTPPLGGGGSGGGRSMPAASVLSTMPAAASSPSSIASLIGKLSGGPALAPPSSMPAMPAAAPVPAAAMGMTAPAGQINPAMIASLIGQLSSVPGLSSTVGGTTSRQAALALTQEGIQRACPGLFEIVYGQLGLRCGQCGLRFSDDERGQARMSAHLDRHFKQNRRLKERTRKVISRCWFVRDEDWVHSRLVTNEDENVISPPEDEKLPCPICQEKFEEFWCDEEEEWMLRNAVMVNGKIYHATCHIDASMAVEEPPSSNASSNANSPAPSGVLGKRKFDKQLDETSTMGGSMGSATTTTTTTGMGGANDAAQHHALPQHDTKKMAVTIQMVR
ncbi:hypothetical protein SYNPS1DRAFT_30662 [Syncephalis pseudoplumigaleata]|uniref:PCFS4-like zinc finger domain-containing protein n=1 Tax=Syncephalis pseudoplumigaleata TaxID=1712513 RepID=A0A4P9YX99_9FUNG|nr:hypothetical protein SYNPS1DRAFT_30662 [Syncephalis pseudoplumigaleata]|eukprot:RKP23580.1 hypothetical protein SYNPS1DRAFT_30662 [Syncephalis pseudoplumigaleata]